MDPLLTPSTAFLNSLLEPDNFYSSEPPRHEPSAEQDKFSQAFETHNNASAQSDALLKARPAESSLSSHNYFTLNTTLEEPLPGLTNPSSSSSGAGDSSASPEQELRGFNPYGQLSPRSRARIERNTAQEWWALGNYEQEAQLRQYDVEMAGQHDPYMPTSEIESHQKPAPAIPRKGRKRAKLTKDELDEKHRAFLERNRVAAGKCRTRKKKRVEGLEERFMTVKGVNFGLKEAVRGLEAEIWSLKECLGRNSVAGSMIPGSTTLDGELEAEERQEEGEENEGPILQQEALGEKKYMVEATEAIQGDNDETKAED